MTASMVGQRQDPAWIERLVQFDTPIQLELQILDQLDEALHAQPLQLAGIGLGSPHPEYDQAKAESDVRYEQLWEAAGHLGEAQGNYFMHLGHPVVRRARSLPETASTRRSGP